MNRTSGDWSWLLRPLEHFGRAAFRFMFPPSCPLCLRSTETGSWRFEDGRFVTPVLCPECIAAVSSPPGNRCFRCGRPLGPFVKSNSGCPNCRQSKFRFQQVIRLGLYDDKLRAACIRSKAPMQHPLSAALANLLWFDQRSALEEIQADFITYVPRHWFKRFWNNHHSAETVASVLSHELKTPLLRTLLHKTRMTTDQSDLTGPQRRQNLRGAFTVWFLGRRRIQGKTVLLVDDILTTGTTANECTRTLLEAGAKKVVVAVIAVVPQPSYSKPLPNQPPVSR